MPTSTSDDGYISCKSCEATFPSETFPDDFLENLMTRRDYQNLVDEMELLNRAKALLDAHPEAEQVIQSIQWRGVNSIFSDGEGETWGGEQWLAEDRQLERWTEGDPELREYLTGGTPMSELGMRRLTVQSNLIHEDWIRSIPVPDCPRCGENALRFEGRVDWVSYERKKKQREQA